MNEAPHSLRTQLLSFYLGSLVILAIFFYVGVHIFGLPYSTELFLLLLFILAIMGFFIIRRITSSLINLTQQIKLISSHNLDKPIKGIKSRDEIGDLARSFNDLLKRLNDAFQREQQFIADVAHELKTPLATQRSSLEVSLSKDRNKREYKKALEEALLDNNHLTSTLKNILDLAWSETPHEQRNIFKFNVSELTEELYDIAVKMAVKKHITIRHTIKRNVFVLGFKDKLARALLNLLDNAIKYTPEQGKIDLMLSKKDDRAVITIEDTGGGVRKEDIPHIFDRFYRGSMTDNIFGSGLGLAITKSIINVHKGEIKVKSELGKGSVFIVYLPLVP